MVQGEGCREDGRREDVLVKTVLQYNKCSTLGKTEEVKMTHFRIVLVNTVLQYNNQTANKRCSAKSGSNWLAHFASQ